MAMCRNLAIAVVKESPSSSSIRWRLMARLKLIWKVFPSVLPAKGGGSVLLELAIFESYCGVVGESA